MHIVQWSVRGPVLIKSKVTWLQGRKPVEFFFFNFLELKGYEVTKATGVTGVTSKERDGWVRWDDS